MDEKNWNASDPTTLDEATLQDLIVHHYAALDPLKLYEAVLRYFQILTVGDPQLRYSHYALCEPALFRIYTHKQTAFRWVARAMSERVGLPIGAIEDDMKKRATAERQAEASPEAPGTGRSQADQLVALAAHAELWHTPEGDSYASIEMNGHTEHYLLSSKNFRRWLRKQYYDATGRAPGSQAVQDALGTLDGKAQFDGPEHPVFVRIAEHRAEIYVDLADSAWRAVKITKDGWDIVASPPVKFRRPRGVRALPHPKRGGTVEKLRAFLNIADKDRQTWILLLAWLVMALCPKGPFPILILHGEQGTAKSTLARMLKALIDPNDAPLRAEPKEKRDLMIAAINSWALVYDNLSHIPVWLSDSLCRLATGAGFGVRELYTDQEETILTAQRPIVINGIEEVATRGDILDRAVNMSCPVISPWKRKAEKKLWTDFTEQCPAILGALLTAVSTAVKNLPTVTLQEAPRMADFATWVVAAAPALGFTAREFLEAYNENRQGAHRISLEDSLLTAPVCALAEKGRWDGTATALLERLNQDNPEAAKKKGWPQTPQSLSNHLRRIAPNLRGVGISVEFRKEQDKARTRKICIQQIDQADEPQQEHPGDSSSAASAESETQQNQGDGRTRPDDNPSHADDPMPHSNGAPSGTGPQDFSDLWSSRRTPDDAADDHRNGRASDPSTHDFADLDTGRTMADASDDKCPPYSNGHTEESGEEELVDDGTKTIEEDEEGEL